MEKISPKLLEILACPLCKGDLTLDEANSELLCLTSKLAFKITDGIPNMLLDEARQLKDEH